MNFRMYGIVVHQFRITVLVFFDYVTVKLTPTSRGFNANKVSVEMLQCLLLQIKKKNNRFVPKVVWNKRKEKNLWFVKKLVELHLVSGSIVLTVPVQYIGVWMRE